MTQKIQPLGARVLVKRSSNTTTKGGIILPDSAQEKPKMGEVVAVGPGKADKDGKIKALEVSVGDKVLFSSYAGTEVKGSGDEELLILQEDDLLAITS
ncbi:MAG: co-chaperone GroES [Chlamydiales bacterium]|nr:co-chaperone GroES [Chlamydiales bacterium]